MADQVSARYLTVMKWVGLAIGCSAKFVSGTLFVFNSYEDALKTTFNFTAKEVQLQSSFLSIGLGVGFLPGMLFDRFGPQWTSGVGLVISLAAYLLLWSTTRSVEFYSKRSWLTAFYFLLCGLGSLFTYMVALNTNVINFHPKHRGKIVGILNAFFAGSPSVFAALYYHVIGKENPKSADSFSNLMLLFAVCFVVIDVMCIAFMRVLPRTEITDKIIPEVKTNDTPDDVTQAYNKGFIGDNNISTGIQSSDEIDDTRASDTVSIVPNGETDFGATSILTILTTLDYQLLTWVITLGSVAGLVYTDHSSTRP